MTTNVKCYHIYIRKDDRYDGHIDLCREHAEDYPIPDGQSLHASSPTNRPCEVCDAQSTES